MIIARTTFPHWREALTRPWLVPVAAALATSLLLAEGLRAWVEPGVLWCLTAPLAAVLISRLRNRVREQLTRATQAEAQLRALLAASPDALIVTANDGSIMYSNSRSKALLCRAGEPVPCPLPELLPRTAGRAYHAAREAVLTLAARGQWDATRLDIELPAAAGNRSLELRLCAFPHEGSVLLLHTLTDVTEAKLARAAEDLARRESLQREFVANVSHELRTPVAAIRGFAETLRLGALKEPEVASEFVETIERHAERLQRLIEDLLEISVLESGRRPARPEPIDLGRFIWEFYKGLAPLAEKKRLRLRVNLEPGLTLWMDREHLGQVLQNLCDNAIKFNRRGGTVTLEGRPDGESALVSVKDTGPGITKEQMPVLFERFHRKTKSTQENVPSTGLGLSIVKGILELNGGEIWAESSPEGATFHFRVPCAPSDREPALADPRGNRRPSYLS